MEYFNIFKLQHKLGKGMEDHSENEEEKYLSFECNEVKRVLKPMIECGPTVVFSDCAPREDKAIKRFWICYHRQKSHTQLSLRIMRK